MARVLLLVPPLLERSYPGKFMGLEYIATALALKGHKVKCLDLDVLYSRRDIGARVVKYYRDILREYEPNVVGVTNVSLQNDLANFMCWIAKSELPKAIIVKGGYHEITGWEFTLELHNRYVDACVVGEGEIAMQQIAEAADKKQWEEAKTEIPSLAYWDGKKAVLNEGTQRVDANMFVVDHSISTYYSEYNFDVLGGGMTAQVMTVRGCPFHCSFCSEAFFSPTIRERSLGNIEQEFVKLKELGFEAIYFDDSTFTLKPERTRNLISIINQYGFVWGCNTRVDQLNEELLVEMSKGGCKYLFCGVESLIPETLLAMRKTTNPQKYIEQANNVYKWLRKAGISPSVFLIFGNARMEDALAQPERFEDVKETLDKVANEIDTDFLSMNILRLIPEVPFSKELMYAPIRPTGEDPVHAGYYDIKWYEASGTKDIRSNHPIFRCFEGARSVNTVIGTPEYAYQIMDYAIKKVNEHNNCNNRQIRIVVDSRAYDFLHERHIGGRIEYQIDDFDRMPKRLEDDPLLEEWKRIVIRE